MWMDSLFVLIQIVYVPLCRRKLSGDQTSPPCFSSFSSSRGTLSSLPPPSPAHSWGGGNPSSPVSIALPPPSAGRELASVTTSPPSSCKPTTSRGGEGGVKLMRRWCCCGDSPFYSSASSFSSFLSSLTERAIELNLVGPLVLPWSWKGASAFS